MAQSLDLLIASHLRRKERDTDIGEGLDRTQRAVNSFAELRQRQRENQFNNILKRARINKALTDIENTRVQSQLLNGMLKTGGTQAIQTAGIGTGIQGIDPQQSQQDQASPDSVSSQKTQPDNFITGFNVGGFNVASASGLRREQQIKSEKVGETQKKGINEIQATAGTVNRVAGLMEKVPDLGKLDTSNIAGKALSILPRGLEGRARASVSEFLTAGEGGGLSGLTKEEDSNLRTYLDSLPTIGGELYKALSGDTGRLSDFDIERGMNLAWRPDKGQAPRIRKLKIQALQEAVTERERAIRNGRFTLDPETGAILTPQVVEFAEQKMAGIEVMSSFKPGDEKEINGTIYVRGEDGKWRPKSKS